MTDRDLARSAVPDNDTPDAARARLAAGLRASGRALSPPVQRAFAQVPRHLFVPGIEQATAYRDEAFVLKCGPDGIPVSSSSQPAMMAIMLEQLDLKPGHRVLEIGTGSGYNAALMSLITSPGGTVVTVDIDSDLAAKAESTLTAAGFAQVQVESADGGYGYPPGAPYDRIIVTAGVWDITPAWLEQLADDGRLVLPLSIRGIELSVALERADGHWLTRSACRCGFVRMLGAYARPQQALWLGGHEHVLVQLANDGPIDTEALRLALDGEFVDVPAGIDVEDQGELGDLDLWLTCTEPELERLTLLTSAVRQLGPLPLGGLVCDAGDRSRLGVATVLPVSPAASGPPTAEVVVRGYGPGREQLAEHLADRTAIWAELGRPATADVALTVWPPDAEISPTAGLLVVDRPSVRIAIGWPA